uniref:Replicative DNA helicase n=2 Tax=Anaerobacillus isosaccharinicus TaxID=1532552 RepID=A0A1S2L9Q4_9BACI
MIENEFLENSGEREKSFAYMVPLYELERIRKYPYPMRSLGFAILLYILEHMLNNSKTCSLTQIRHFLKALVLEQFGDELEEEEVREVAITIVQDHLQNRGIPHKYEYWDFEEKSLKYLEFHLIQIVDYKINGTTYLELTSECIEMLFKTRELYNEMRVSIKSLFFRQQIEKGVFDGALREIKELSIDVKEEKNNIQRLRERIMKEALKVSKENEFKKQLERVNEQLYKEKTVFKEIDNLIDDTMKQYEKGELEDDKRNAVILIKKMKRGLQKTNAEHEELFVDKLDLQRFMNQSLDSLIYRSFLVKINFEKDVVEKVLKGTSLLGMQQFLQSLLFRTKYKKSLYPSTWFQLQRFKSREESTTGGDIPSYNEELERRQIEHEETVRKWKVDRLRGYLEVIANPLLTREEVYLSDVLNELKNENKEHFQEIMDSADFLPFLITLDRIEQVLFLRNDELKVEVFEPAFHAVVDLAERSNELWKMQGFQIERSTRELRFDNGDEMTDWKFIRGVVIEND